MTMEFLEYRDTVRKIKIGKQLPDSTYIHKSAFSALPKSLTKLTLDISNQFKIKDSSWNIIKFYKKDFKIAFLNYPTFKSESYPTLNLSQIVDLHKELSRSSDYSKSTNPPILHRKETFVSATYPLRTLFEEITAEGEALGLYDKTSRIGFRENWEKLIRSKGHYLDDEGRLKPLTDRPNPKPENTTFLGNIERHKTAIDRNQLSQPMQALARHDYLNGEYSILDYGCGKGDDVRELEAHGINVTGWDPAHRPDEKLTVHDIVNLGFVLNVIEEREERTETLISSWRHTNKLLIVSVMVAGESVISKFRPYKDGIITSRNTFQKYYSQGEIRYYIESSLEESAIAVGQGSFLVFKDKLEEQLFLAERQHIKRGWKQKTQRQLSLKVKAVKEEIIDKHLELFTDYWNTTLDLGRIPANSEFDFSHQIRRICGSHNKAHHALLKYFGEEVFAESQAKRKEDLIVYFALSMFEKRRAQSNMPESLKRDIKAFFSSYNDALEAAREILFSVGSPVTIYNACEDACSILGCGYLEDNQSFTFHKDYLGDLPAVLRIYVGCATQLYGDIEDFQLIKAHIRSGKVSLMRYDDWNKDEPLLIERLKIKLRELDINFYDYGEKFSPPALSNKALYE